MNRDSKTLEYSLELESITIRHVMDHFNKCIQMAARFFQIACLAVKQSVL